MKVGASAAGAAAAAAHTGALAGDQRIFRALVEEAGAAWARDVHELLELAKALAVPGSRRSGSGLALLTCSGGDSALAADECERTGLPPLPPFAPSTATRLRELLPEAATVANPLDYTALIWGDVERLRDIVVASGADPGVDRVLVLYDQPVGIEGAAAESWANVREGILQGAAASPVPVMVASTLPELLDDAAAARFADAGVPAIAGVRTGIACVAALESPPGQPARLREIAAAARRAGGSDGRGRPLSEHDAKELLREAGLPVVDGRLVSGADDAVAALGALGGPLVLKLAAPGLRHKTEAGAVVLDVHDEEGVRAAHARLAGLAIDGATRAGRADGADPAPSCSCQRPRAGSCRASCSAAGGLWTELLDDAAVIPLPASPERVERAVLGLRAAPLLRGGRGQPAARRGCRGAARLGRRRAAARAWPRAARAQPRARARARRDGGRRRGGAIRGAPLRAAVVGAGLAGLTAAWELRATGGEVVVLEARERVGGRVWSRTLANGAVVEMGAEYLLPGNSAIRELVERFGLGFWDKGMRYGNREPRGGLGTDAGALAAATRTRRARPALRTRRRQRARAFLDGIDLDPRARARR